MNEIATIKTTKGEHCSVFYVDKPNGSFVYAVYDEVAKRYCSVKQIPQGVKRVISLMNFKLALYKVKDLVRMGV